MKKTLLIVLLIMFFVLLAEIGFAQSDYLTYVPKKGDTWASVAAEHNVPLKELLAFNGIVFNGSFNIPLYVGVAIKIPIHKEKAEVETEKEEMTVEKGETKKTTDSYDFYWRIFFISLVCIIGILFIVLLYFLLMDKHRRKKISALPMKSENLIINFEGGESFFVNCPVESGKYQCPYPECKSGKNSSFFRCNDRRRMISHLKEHYKKDEGSHYLFTHTGISGRLL